MSPIILKSKAIKTRFKNIAHISIILIFNIFFVKNFAQEGVKNKAKTDTISLKDSTSAKKEHLEDIVRYKADNIRNDIAKKMTFLNKNAQVTYLDMKIDADYISVDWTTGNVFARGEQDENSRVIKPVITLQAGKEYQTDQFTFNYKTQKAIAYNTRTEESGGVIVAEKSKKANDSVFYMRRGLYTTDDYFLKKKDSLADYHLLASNIKLVKGKRGSQIITGPIQMYVEQVPTPLVMPFAILPFSDKRSAGILIPSFGERQDVGFFLNGLGYYQPIGEHFDFKALVDIYTKGSWTLRPELNYKKNYKYNGSFSAEIGTTVTGIKGLDDYSRSGTYRIGWRHSQDPKANPFFNFSASVDMVSSKFYNRTVNNTYLLNGSNLNTQQNSSISITKRFLTLPFTITGAASYSQNFADGMANIRLPNMNVAINQFYLFKPRNGGIRQGLLENIAINTGLNFTNYVNIHGNEFLKKEMWDKMQTALQNNVSLSTNATIFKYFTFSMGASANNVFTTKTLTRSYNPITNAVEDRYNRKIAGYSTFSTSASLQTTLYGMLNFKKNSRIQAIRHMVIPSLSFSYSPDFGKPGWGYFKNYYNAQGALTPYSIFEGSIAGAPTTGLSQTLGLNISNNIEMKVKSKSDSTGVKKIKLFESLNISTGYNFAAEQHKMSLININGQTSLFQKLSINSSLVLDPYKIEYNAQGEGIRTEKLGGFSPQGFNVQLSFPLSSELFKSKDKKEKAYPMRGEIRNEVYSFDDSGYAHFDQSWTLNLNANYSYYRGTSRFGNKVAALGLDGTMKLTPYWNLTYSTNYDFVTNQIAYTRLGFNRDQRSFTISFNWVPFGTAKLYDFFIGIKANILSDALKYKDRSFPSNSKF